MAMQTHGPEHLRSPNKSLPCLTIEGDPETIKDAGQRYSDLGERMSDTASELGKLGANEKYRAKSLDSVRESATTAKGDLEKAAIRYENSGPVLVTYGDALEVAQSTITVEFVDSILTAHTARQDAESARSSAQSTVNDYSTTHFWETEATDQEQSSAATTLSTAKTDLSSAETELDGLWDTFESTCNIWSQAYDDAVAGLEKAMELSGIDDTWWEDMLDGLASIASVVGFVAVIAAVIFGGPILLALAAVAGLVALVAHGIMMMKGSRRVSWTDIALDAIGVIPFGKTLATAGKGLPALARAGTALKAGFGFSGASRATVAAGRSSIIGDLGTIAGRGRGAGGQAARARAAPGIADDFLTSALGNTGRSIWAGIRSGGTKWDRQVLSITDRLGSEWATAGGSMRARTANWLGDAGTSTFDQSMNVINFAIGGYSNTSMAAGAAANTIRDGGVTIPTPSGQ